MTYPPIPAIKSMGWKIIWGASTEEVARYVLEFYGVDVEEDGVELGRHDLKHIEESLRRVGYESYWSTRPSDTPCRLKSAKCWRPEGFSRKPSKPPAPAKPPKPPKRVLVPPASLPGYKPTRRRRAVLDPSRPPLPRA